MKSIKIKDSLHKELKFLSALCNKSFNDLIEDSLPFLKEKYNGDFITVLDNKVIIKEFLNKE